MKKFLTNNPKSVLALGFVIFLILLIFLTVQAYISPVSIFLLVIPILASIVIFEKRIYILFSVIVLFTFIFLAKLNGLESNDIASGSVIFIVSILFGSEFIKWYIIKSKAGRIAVLKSEEKYRNLVENLHEIIYTSDENGKVTFVNSAFEKITGFPKEVLMESDPAELIHPNDYEKFMQGIEQVKGNKKLENFEYRAKTANGNYLNFLTTIQPINFKKSKFQGLTGIATDITKIKEAETVIINNKKNLDAILSAIPDLLLIFDSEGNYLDVFPHESRYLYKTYKELRGENITEILPKKVAEDFMLVIRKAINTSQLVNYKYNLPIKGNNIKFSAHVKRITYNGQIAVLWDTRDITQEEKLLKQLEEDKRKFENLLNYTYDWEYWLEPDGKIGYTSPSCFEQTGYTAEEFINNPDLLYQIVHDEDKEKFKKHVSEVQHSGAHGKIEFRIIMKSGKMHVLRHTCQAIYDGDNFIGRRITNRNSTDRWKAEKKLKASEKEYKSIFNSLIDVYYRIKLDGTVENVSPSVEKISGYKREDILGKNAASFYVDPELREKLFRETLAKGGINNFEIEMKDGTGKIKTVSMNNKLVYDVNGVPIAIEGMLRDVTELKQARQELLDTKNELQNYLAIARIMILVLDKNGNVKLINKKGCKILGCEQEEIIGKNWVSNFIPENQRDETKKIFQKNLKGDTELVKVHENDIINKNGQIRTIRWNNSYLEDSDGNITGTISSGEDITNEKKMLLELKESEKRLRELNASKDKFFSIVAHDIRSPFTALLGFTQILEEEFGKLTTEEINEIVHSLRKTANNIFEFIEGLLDWSRVQSNNIEIKPIRLKLFNVIQDVFVLLSSSALAKKVKIEIDVPKDLLVLADENVVNTVLRNLVSNAIKFTSENDTITIFVENSGKEEIVVCVSDTGVGLTEEIKSKLFKLDEHISEPGTNKEKGTGLGLLLCKDLLEKQQNKIWAENNKNRGSTFKFTLKQLTYNNISNSD